MPHRFKLSFSFRFPSSFSWTCPKGSEWKDFLSSSAHFGLCSHLQQLQRFLDSSFIFEFFFKQTLPYLWYTFEVPWFFQICLVAPLKWSQGHVGRWPWIAGVLAWLFLPFGFRVQEWMICSLSWHRAHLIWFWKRWNLSSFFQACEDIEIWWTPLHLFCTWYLLANPQESRAYFSLLRLDPQPTLLIQSIDRSPF